MRWHKSVTLIEAHAEGEVGRIVTDFNQSIPGDSVAEKLQYINEVDDSVRRFLVFEPRGSVQMSTVLTFPPTHPDADIGFLVLQADQAHAMSGSNAICLVTVLLETGRVAMLEPTTTLVLETAVGLVEATATCADGKCQSVSLNMPVSFALLLDAEVNVEGLGPIKVDICFGGIFYGLVNESAIDTAISRENAGQLVSIAGKIHKAIDQQLEFAHPSMPQMNKIAYVMVTGESPEGELKGATILPPGRIDRSPCGTGCSARLAAMVARGDAKVGDSYIARSIIDSRFELAIQNPAATQHLKTAHWPAIQPRVTGRGWVHGIHQIGIDPTDPYPFGFTLSDCWGAVQADNAS